MSFLLCLLNVFSPILLYSSVNESKEVSHLLLTDALVPVSAEEEKKGEEEDKSRRGQLKRKTPALTSQEVKHIMKHL